jgi:hypothetical protein
LHACPDTPEDGKPIVVFHGFVITYNNVFTPLGSDASSVASATWRLAWNATD